MRTARVSGEGGLWGEREFLRLFVVPMLVGDCDVSVGANPHLASRAKSPVCGESNKKPPCGGRWHANA